MKVLRQDIVDRLREEGDMGSAHRAETELPVEVDSEEDREVLDRIGLDLATLFPDS